MASLLRRMRSRRVWRGFARDEEGVSAVEFALVAPMFLLTLFTSMDLGATYMGGRLLDASVDELVRKVRIGTIRNELSVAEARNELCASTFASVFDCDRIWIRLHHIDDIPGPGSSPADPDSGSFRPGARSTLNVIEVSAPWPRIFYVNFTDSGPGKLDEWRVTSRNAFMIEPY